MGTEKTEKTERTERAERRRAEDLPAQDLSVLSVFSALLLRIELSEILGVHLLEVVFQLVGLE